MRIALVLGGVSAEREVSLESGKEMLKALRELGYEYFLVDPAFGKEQPKNESDFFSRMEIPPAGKRNYLEAVNSSLFENVDFALLALHGQFGEDGVIQSLLELRGVPYSGSGVMSSAVAMDKSTSKILFQHFDVKTPEWILLKSRDYNLGLTLRKID